MNFWVVPVPLFGAAETLAGTAGATYVKVPFLIHPVLPAPPVPYSQISLFPEEAAVKVTGKTTEL